MIKLCLGVIIIQLLAKLDGYCMALGVPSSPWMPIAIFLAAGLIGWGAASADEPF